MKEIHGNRNEGTKNLSRVVDNFVKRYGLRKGQIIETVFPLIKGYAVNVLCSIQNEKINNRLRTPEEQWEKFKELMDKQNY